MTERKHNPRCEYAKNKDECECRCGGALHSSQHRDNKDNDNYDRVVNINLGGEVGKFITEVKGKSYNCLGVCHKSNRAILFLAYSHDGGLKDKDKNKWWIFIECDNKLRGKRECGYQMAYHKIKARLVK